MNINPTNSPFITYRIGNLINLTPEKISQILGFTPNFRDDPIKVKNSWHFTIDGRDAAIWDWMGSEKKGVFSFYGSREQFERLFGIENVC